MSKVLVGMKGGAGAVPERARERSAGSHQTGEYAVCAPAGSRDWLLPLSSPRTRALWKEGVSLAGITAAQPGYTWRGPGATHLLLGSLEGAGELEIDGRIWQLPRGSLVLAPAGCARAYGTEGRWRFLAIRISADRFPLPQREGAVELPATGLPRLRAPMEGMLAEHVDGFDAFVDARATGEAPMDYLMSRHAGNMAPPAPLEQSRAPRADTLEVYATVLANQLRELLQTHLASPAGGRNDEEVALAGLWARVQGNPEGPWDADDLARALGASRTTMYRMVKRCYGDSPAKIVERIRMDEARRLLSRSEFPLAVIADSLGYSSAFSFSTAFKRFSGESPSTYRRRAAPDRAGSVDG